ncbi:MAG: dihydrofolate reductase family protein [Flavobacteriaceae bacterium]|nr:dihydrofolate reductase family protein [Flavobacteriaceae bacterium]
MTAKITLHMVSSLDGFIAKKDGSISWMRSTDTYEKGMTLSDEDIADVLQKIDCYVMGSRTYEHALELGWPYGDTPVVVVTSRILSSNSPSVSFYSGDLKELVNNILRSKYQNTWLVGGALLSKGFLQQNLVDDIIISIMPVILGDGTLFFDFIGKEQDLHLIDVTAYKDGMVELWYELN